MIERTSRARQWAAGGAVAIAVAVGGWAGTAIRADEASPRALAEQLEVMQVLVQNARMKLRHGVVQEVKGPAQERERRPARPAETCCMANIKGLERSISNSGKIIQELDAYYRLQGDVDARLALSAVRDQLAEFGKGVIAFARATQPAEADGAMQGLIRPFNALRGRILDLESCCSPPGVSDTQ